MEKAAATWRDLLHRPPDHSVWHSESAAARSERGQAYCSRQQCTLRAVSVADIEVAALGANPVSVVQPAGQRQLIHQGQRIKVRAPFRLWLVAAEIGAGLNDKHGVGTLLPAYREVQII